MKRFSISLLTGLFLLTLFPACSGIMGNNKTDLRISLKPGDTFTFESLAEQTINQTIMGMDQSVEQSIGYTFTYDVKESTEAGYKVGVTYDRIIYKQTSPMGEVDYDSETYEGEPPLQASGFAALLGKSFEIVLDTKGEVTAVDGVDKMLDEMMGELDNLPDAAKEQLKAQFGDDQMRQNMQNMSVYYPAKPVKVGDAWQQDGSLQNMIEMDMMTTYKLMDKSDDAWTIEFASEVNTPEGAEPMSMNGMEIAYNIGGTQKGTNKVNPADGMLTSSTFTQLFSGNMQMNMNGQELEWPITIESTNTMTRK